MKRAVPDTNILVSAFVYGGTPASFVTLGASGGFVPITSLNLLDELEATLARKFSKSPAQIAEIRAEIEAYFEIVSTHESIHFIKADPDDDRVLECAVAGRADYIVSGDKHLRNLRTYEGVLIVSIREFLDILNPPA